MAEDRARAKLHPQLRGIFDQPAIHRDHVGSGNRKPDMLSKAGGQQLISENPEMLRIVLELDDVKMPIGGPHEMRLCAAAHPPDMLDCLNGHGKSATKS